MRGIILILTVAGASLLVAAEPPTAVELQRLLVLEATTAEGVVVHPGQRSFEVTLRLRNTGDRALPVVLPGDGSGVGWREPAVDWAGDYRQEEGGDWKPLPRAAIGRCGLFDRRWEEDVVRLGPGASTEPGAFDWVERPGPHVRIPEEAVRVRLRATYRYRRGAEDRIAKTQTVDPRALGVMEDLPAFTLHSNWIELPVRPEVEPAGP